MANVNSGNDPVQFRRSDAERINSAVLAHESRRRPRNSSRLPRAFDNGLVLGKVAAAWDIGTLATVTINQEGDALQEVPSNPPETIEECVNKFADIAADSWVMLGIANGRWYVIAAECKTEEGPGGGGDSGGGGESQGGGE